MSATILLWMDARCLALRSSSSMRVRITTAQCSLTVTWPSCRAICAALTSAVMAEFLEMYGGDGQVTTLTLDDFYASKDVQETYHQLKSWDWTFGQTPDFVHHIPVAPTGQTAAAAAGGASIQELQTNPRRSATAATAGQTPKQAGSRVGQPRRLPRCCCPCRRRPCRRRPCRISAAGSWTLLTLSCWRRRLPVPDKTQARRKLPLLENFLIVLCTKAPAPIFLFGHEGRIHRSCPRRFGRCPPRLHRQARPRARDARRLRRDPRSRACPRHHPLRRQVRQGDPRPQARAQPRWLRQGRPCPRCHHPRW
ncbi:hypothetical protein BC831DRAFT_11730 [Entophlyctis helioformis]|nr:hypothetical protein BC831DRAFT_11730 [Entophlyctis helioformis]